MNGLGRLEAAALKQVREEGCSHWQLLVGGLRAAKKLERLGLVRIESGYFVRPALPEAT
jgi:hypothetical protein